MHCDHMKSVLEKDIKCGLVWDPKKECKIAAASECHGPLRHCTMNLIDCVAHAQGSGAWPSNTDFEVHKDTNDNAYLLTKYDVYLSHEPCIMCAMALVHSRVARVFFAQPSPEC